eukprot:997605_1
MERRELNQNPLVKFMVNETKATNGYPEEGTRKQQLEYLLDQCDSTKTSKERTRLLKKTNGMISDPITPSFIITVSLVRSNFFKGKMQGIEMKRNTHNTTKQTLNKHNYSQKI